MEKLQQEFFNRLKPKDIQKLYDYIVDEAIRLSSNWGTIFLLFPKDREEVIIQQQKIEVDSKGAPDAYSSFVIYLPLSEKVISIEDFFDKTQLSWHHLNTDLEERTIRFWDVREWFIEPFDNRPLKKYLIVFEEIWNADRNKPLMDFFMSNKMEVERLEKLFNKNTPYQISHNCLSILSKKNIEELKRELMDEIRELKNNDNFTIVEVNKTTSIDYADFE